MIRPSLRQYLRKQISKWTAASLLVQQILWTPVMMAAENPTVVGGSANIVHQGTTLDVTTLTDRTIINWDKFNIPQGNTANFYQPHSTSAVLNRVTTTNNPSGIYGNLFSNGNVFLINPAGIVVGPSGVVNTNGFTASVFDISNNNFMKGGNLEFSGSSKAAILNQGIISTGPGGATLLGSQVINEGLIESNGGNINLLTGGSVTLRGGGIYTQADQATLSNGISETAGLIRNTGTLRATGVLESGGEIYLVSPGGHVFHGAIARATKEGAGGKVVVDAGSGTATISGQIDVSGTTGGQVAVTGQHVVLNGADILADGENGGGKVNIGGGFQGKDASLTNSQSTTIDADSRISANALSSGDGGQVIIWSDGDTLFQGEIYARGSRIGEGGFVEVSGKRSLSYQGRTFTGGGTLLLDPYNYTIDENAANNIVQELSDNNVIVATTQENIDFGSTLTDDQDGHIWVNYDIIWDTAYSLSLLAEGNIYFNANVQNTNTTANAGGDLNVVAGWDGTTGFTDGQPFDLTDFLAANVMNDTVTIFGNNEGSVFIGHTDSEVGVAVGSANGSTNLFAYDLTLQGGTIENAPAYAQLGFHHTMGNIGETVTTGDITVALRGDLSLLGGSSTRDTVNNLASFAQIGHGGFRASSINSWDYTGDIHVSAAGDTSLIAGQMAHGAALIGHGGFNAHGNHSGDITLFTDNLLLYGGTVNPNQRDRYTMIGHGANAGNATGTRQGDIFVSVNNETTLVEGTRWIIGHNFVDADATLSNANVTFLTGTLDYDANNITPATQSVLSQGFLDMLVHNLKGGSVTVGSTNEVTGVTGGMVVDGTMFYESEFNLNLLSAADIRFNGSVQNSFVSVHDITAGDINIVAGWDGESGFRTHNNRLVFSPWRFFRENVQKDDVTRFGNNQGSVYIGHSEMEQSVAVGSANGDTNLFADNLTLRGSDTVRAFAQLGFNHAGGEEPQETTITTGDINVSLTGNLIAQAGSQSLMTPTITSAVQIGHGGNRPIAEDTQSWNYTGDITISAKGDVSLIGNLGVATYAQIGNGGDYANGDHSGDLHVRVGGDLSLTGGKGTSSFVQIGNRGRVGDVTGNVTVIADGDILLQGGSSYYGYAQIGNGGSGATGDQSGNIIVKTDSNLTLKGGSTAAYAQIGNGNASQLNSGNMSGDILIVVDDETSLVNGTGLWWIGHRSKDVNAISDANVTFLTGTLDYDSDVNDITERTLLNQNFADVMTFNLAAGDVTIGSTNKNTGSDGGMVVDGSMLYSSEYNLNFLSQADIRFNASIQNASIPGLCEESGDINIVAGWDGKTGLNLHRRPFNSFNPYSFNKSDVFKHRMNLYGNRSGSVYIGNDSLENGVAVGSANGNTNLFAHDLILRGSDTSAAYAQLGFHHTSGSEDIPTTATTGDINVKLTGSLEAVSGDVTTNLKSSYVQIGHGGNRATFDPTNHWHYTGDITIFSKENVSIKAGDGLATYALIGNGGGWANGNHGGEINVVLGKDLLIKGGGDLSAFAQIGHHGFAGDLTGDLTVSAGRNIELRGGTAGDAHAQIGNGGAGVPGHHYGDIIVTAGKNLTLRGGAEDVYAQIGHGNGSGLFESTMSGNILVRVNKETSLVNQDGLWWIGHRSSTENAISDANVTFETGTLDYSTKGYHPTKQTLLNQDFADAMVSNLSGGHVTIISTNKNTGYKGGMVVDGEMTYSSENNLNFLSLADIRFNASVQNTMIPGFCEDAGDINIVAGWDGKTGLNLKHKPFVPFNAKQFHKADVFKNNMKLFGNRSGSVYIGNRSMENGVAVGSANGSTNLFAHDLILRGSDSAPAYAQLGAYTIGLNGQEATTVTTGDIKVYLTGSLSAKGGKADSSHGQSSYVQIGHGANLTGLTDIESWNHSGEITIKVKENMMMEGGRGNFAYAQLGHGGAKTFGNHNGDISVTVGNDLFFSAGEGENAYAQLGHGGQDARGDYNGSVFVIVKDDLSFSAGKGKNAYAQLGHGGQDARGDYDGNIFVMVKDDLSFSAGSGKRAYAQLGHGGQDTSGDYNGNIFVMVGDDASFNAGRGSEAYAQLGHGGQDARGDYDGNIFVMVKDDLSFSAGKGKNAYAQLGHGGQDARGNYDGNIFVMVKDDLSFSAGEGKRAYVQLGHGGQDASGNYDGNILVKVDGDASFSAGRGDEAYAQLGHGGQDARGDYDGNIFVMVKDDLSFSAGKGKNAYAQLGHGGQDATGNYDGNIFLKVGDNASFNAGRGNEAYAQLGHGGQDARGDYDGHIFVTVKDDLSFSAGKGKNAYAQLGHGGQDARGNYDGNIFVMVGDDASFRASRGDEAYAQLGHGGQDARGDYDGNIFVTVKDDLSFSAGEGKKAYAQLGHGGQDASGDYNGNIFVMVGDDASFNAGRGSEAYAQLGHGGQDARGDYDGNIFVMVKDDLSFRAGSGKNAYAQLGHGGQDARGDYDGNIFVMVKDDLSFSAGEGKRAYVQLGHGGQDAHGDYNGNILVKVDGDASFRASRGDEAYAQLGHGGQDARGNYDGNILVMVKDDLSFSAGEGKRAYVQLGHGGQDAHGDYNGNILVKVDGDASFRASRGDEAYAQLGHGGQDARGNYDGNIFVMVKDDLSFSAGKGKNAYAQLGHGGQDARGDYNGSIFVMVKDDLSFSAGKGKKAYAQLGHGGQDASGDYDGNIFVMVGDDASFNAGRGSEAYAQLGHGGQDTRGDYDGNIFVMVKDDLSFSAGKGKNAYAQLGHGGQDARGDYNGNIFVIVKDDLSFSAGEGKRAYVQLGHGGQDASGDYNGNIFVMVGDDASFRAGRGDEAYAQLGHGGQDARGDYDGNIFVMVKDDLSFSAGKGKNAYAQLGHGGQDARGDYNGNILVMVKDDLSFSAGSGKKAYVQLGHGGQDARGDYDGNIFVMVGDDASFNAGRGSEAYAQLGHGGQDATGDYDGEIFVLVGDDLSFSAGKGNGAYAQLGHGGLDAFGNYNGDIFVAVGDDVTFRAGKGNGAYAQLGHGALQVSSRFDAPMTQSSSGDISLFLLGELKLLGKDTASRYAIIGHGSPQSDEYVTNEVSGDVTVWVGEGAKLTSATIGHLPGEGGKYLSGNTWISVASIDSDAKLIADGNSQFNSADYVEGETGELRFYIPYYSTLQLADTTKLNGTNAADIWTSMGTLYNTQGIYNPFSGPYNVDQGLGNFAFYLQSIDGITLDLGPLTEDLFDRPENYFRTIYSLFQPTQTGSIQVTPTDSPETGEEPEEDQEGVIPFDLNSSSLQAGL